jgi:hypothetical protein
MPERKPLFPSLANAAGYPCGALGKIRVKNSQAKIGHRKVTATLLLLMTATTKIEPGITDTRNG